MNDIPTEVLGNKRKDEDCITKDSFYMYTAMLCAKQSRDPSTQVGACFVDEDGNIISVGYNKPPKNWNENNFTWKTDVDEIYNKYSYVVHAEMNGITSFNGSIKKFENSTVYVTLFPCKNCAKLLIESGVKKVVSLFDTRTTSKDNICAKRMFEESGVEYVTFDKENLENLKGLCLYTSKDEKDFAKVIKYVPKK